MSTNSPLIRENIQLADLTTFGIKANARYFAEYASERELRHIMRQPEYLDNEVFHLGGGSNVLFTSDWEGLVLRSAIRGIKYYAKDADNIFVIAGAAEEWDDVVKFSIEKGLTGLENLSGIPGQAGASVIQNIGAYGAEAADHFFKAECFDTFTGEIVTFNREQCQFDYRHSYFKGEGRGRYYILRVSYLLKPSGTAENLNYGPLKELEAKVGHKPTPAEVRECVIATRNIKLPDPAKIGSAGSFFKNPIVHPELFETLIRPQYPDMPFYTNPDGRIKIPAGWLIEHSGLKALKYGGAEVWPKQCLVIANTGDASSDDVVALADTVVTKVKDTFNITLHREVNYVTTRQTITILGSGTSKGVPELMCRCETCRSDNPHDKRLRSSALVQTAEMNILIDVSPDFRQQILAHGIDRIDCVLLTHEHYDHVGGIDDLRPFCAEGDIPVYALPRVADALRERLPYCFREHAYPGVPKIDLHTINDMPFYFRGVKIEPIEVFHGKMPITGFRIGKIAYITDMKTIEPDELAKLYDLDVLVINALRHTNHFAHLTIEEAVSIIQKVKPERAYLTHLSHEAGLHETLVDELPGNILPAYDGMSISTQ